MPEAITYNGNRSNTPLSAAHHGNNNNSNGSTGISGTSGAACEAASLGGFREAVCMNAGRVYDSCSGKDCLEDMRIYLTECGQSIINEGNSVKCRDIDVLHVSMDVEEVPFNAGYYSVDMTFYFLVTLDVYGAGGCAAPQTVQGVAVFDKKVILFGSEGSVRSFRSDCSKLGTVCTDMPIAQVQTVDPVCLGLRVCEHSKPECGCESVNFPCEIENLLGGPIVSRGGKYLYLTVGLFTIVSLERDIQMMVPVYDFCIPEKECTTSCSEDPCEMFRKIRFPVSEFFPPKQDCCCN